MGRRLSGGLLIIGISDHPIFGALQNTKCCHANKLVAAGIWYT
jgi:hypothetical protein